MDEGIYYELQNENARLLTRKRKQEILTSGQRA